MTTYETGRWRERLHWTGRQLLKCDVCGCRPKYKDETAAADAPHQPAYDCRWWSWYSDACARGLQIDGCAPVSLLRELGLPHEEAPDAPMWMDYFSAAAPPWVCIMLRAIVPDVDDMGPEHIYSAAELDAVAPGAAAVLARVADDPVAQQLMIAHPEAIARLFGGHHVL